MICITMEIQWNMVRVDVFTVILCNKQFTEFTGVSTSGGIQDTCLLTDSIFSNALTSVSTIAAFLSSSLISSEGLQVLLSIFHFLLAVLLLFL